MSSLKQARVLVVGGTSGIGLACARLANEAGARVVAGSRSAERVAETSKKFPGIDFRQFDTHDVQTLESICAELSPLDHIVSAATGAERTMAPFMDQTAEQFSAAFGKFWGYAKVVRAGIPHLKKEGSLTLVSGTPARKCPPGMSSISCVGSAVEGLVRALALELGPKRINCVAPGLIDTPMFAALGDRKDEIMAERTKHYPIARAGKPEEVAQAILFLMQSDYMTGVTLDVDGGQLLP